MRQGLPRKSDHGKGDGTRCVKSGMTICGSSPPFTCSSASSTSCLRGLPDLLCHAPCNLPGEGQQSLLQPLLRQRAVVRPAWGKIRSFPQKGYAPMDGIPVFQIRLSDFLSHHVRQHAVEYLACVCGRGSEAGSHALLDLQTAMELGISRNTLFPRRCSVRIWLLQPYADIHAARSFDNGSV